MQNRSAKNSNGYLRAPASLNIATGGHISFYILILLISRRRGTSISCFSMILLNFYLSIKDVCKYVYVHSSAQLQKKFFLYESSYSSAK